MKRRRLGRRILAAAVIAAAAAGLAALGLGQNAFDGFQNRASDSFFPSAKTNPAVVVVGMDEASFAEGGFGAPPWPRSVHARLARQLTAAGAKVIVWDVVFYSSAEDTATRPDQRAQTEDLAAALQSAADAGVATILGVDGGLEGSLTDHDLRLLDPAYPATPILDAVAAVGAHVKVDTADSDGVVRAVPLVVEDDDGRFVPALSLAAVLAYRDAQLVPVLGRGGVQAGGRLVPTEDHATMRLNFAAGLDGGLDRRSLVSALDVYNGTVNPKRFEDKIVLIGATSESYRDNFDVPVNKSGGMPGVFIHANAVNTMLTASYLDVTDDRVIVVFVALLAFFVALGVLFLPLWASPLLVIVLGLAYLVLALARFDAGHILNLVYPFAMMVAAFVAAVMVRYLTETRHRQRVSKLFAQYVPEAVAQQLVDEGRIEQATEGERLDVSLFFCDLRGFTAISATLTPQQVRTMLNEFYDALTDIILEHRGTVLKFVGDEVFAVFGAPLPVEHHPQVALECALEIQRAAPALSERLATMQIPEVHFGIGMNSGEVVAAHVGGGRRRQYDIVGDTVNIGSRMCGQAGKDEIVMPVVMYRLLDDPPPAESMGFVALKNVEAPMELMRIRVEAPADAPLSWSADATTPRSGATMST